MNINHNDTIVHHIPAPERHVDAPRSDWQLKLQQHQAAVERNVQMNSLMAIQKLTAEIQRTESRIKALRAQVA